VPAEVDEIFLERQSLGVAGRTVRADTVEDRGVVLDDVVDREHPEPEALVLETGGDVEALGD
jgi:hypothetical protein